MPNSKEITISQRRGDKMGFPIHEFNLKDMVDHPAIVMVAKRGSGKSWVVRAILAYYAKKIPVGIIIAPTDAMNGFYNSFVPDSFIYYEFKSETIEKLLNRQNDIIERKHRHQTEMARCLLFQAGFPLSYRLSVYSLDP